MRLPNIYYSNQYFYGVTEPMGKPAPIEKYVGETLDFDVYLSIEGKAVLASDWDIVACVKSNVAEDTPVWSGSLKAGIYENTKQGYYKILIPAEQTKTWLAGTYWLEVLVKEKIAKFNNVSDTFTVLLRLPISVDYGSHSNFKHLHDQALNGTTPFQVDIKRI